MAGIALERGVGARGLRGIIERILEGAMFEIPDRQDVTKVLVDADAVEGRRPPQYVMEQGGTGRTGRRKS